MRQVGRLSMTAVAVALFAACGDKAAPSAAVAALSDTTSLACETLASTDDGGGIGATSPGPRGWLAIAPTRSPHGFALRAPSGRTVSVGRDGEGPGEFRMLSGLGWLGDTVWAADYQVARVQFFDTTGALVRTQKFQQPENWVATGGSNFAAVPGRPLSDSVWRMVAVKGEGMAADTVARFVAPPNERMLIPIGGGNSLMAQQPFGADVAVGWSRDGQRWCASEPKGGDMVRVYCVDPRGATLRDTTLSLPGRPITDSIFEGVLKDYMTSPNVTREAVAQAVKRPAELPRVNGIVVDVSGALWLRRSFRSEPTTRWLRLTAQGAARDTLLLPTSWTVRALRNDTLWASVESAEGAVQLRRCVGKR